LVDALLGRHRDSRRPVFPSFGVRAVGIRAWSPPCPIRCLFAPIRRAG